MSDPMGIRLEEREPATLRANGAPSRAVGSPLSMGSSHRMNGSNAEAPPAHRFTSPPMIHELPAPPAPQPERALANGKPPEQPSTLQKALSTIRMVMPIVQKILPLIDGNIGTAVANLINPQPPAPPAPPPQPKVDLAPLENGLAELQAQHRNLCDQVAEQNSSLKRVEDHLELVREATDRNTLEQQELIEDLKAFSSKVKVAAFVGLGALAVVVALNLILYFHIQRVLP